MTQTCRDDENSQTQESLVVTAVDRMRLSITTIRQGEQPRQEILLRCVVAPAIPVRFPSIRPTTAYPEARQILLQDGWQPVGEMDAAGCSAGSRSGDQRCYPELADCAGTGEGQCLYVWRKGQSVLRVGTVGDPPLVAHITPATAEQAAMANSERPGLASVQPPNDAVTRPSNRPIPQFSQFRISEMHRGRNAPLIMTTEQRNYRTRLGEASRQPPNFAGRFVLTYWGCGTACVTGAVYDALTGRVTDIPFSICCAQPSAPNFNAIEFRPNSRLVIFAGMRNEQPGDMGAHFYEFTGAGFRHLLSVPDDGTFSGSRR